jgi:hypothetical protein
MLMWFFGFVAATPRVPIEEIINRPPPVPCSTTGSLCSGLTMCVFLWRDAQTVRPDHSETQSVAASEPVFGVDSVDAVLAAIRQKRYTRLEELSGSDLSLLKHMLLSGEDLVAPESFDEDAVREFSVSHCFLCPILTLDISLYMRHSSSFTHRSSHRVILKRRFDAPIAKQTRTQTIRSAGPSS